MRPLYLAGRSGMAVEWEAPALKVSAPGQAGQASSAYPMQAAVVGVGLSARCE